MHDTTSLGGLARDRHRMPELTELLPGARFERAWQAFLHERFSESLDLVKDLILRCIARDTQDGSFVSLVSSVSETPSLRDGILLWARNLYHLDRFEEFLELQHDLGRQLRTEDAWSELEVVELEFAYKRGEYGQVVETAGVFIEEYRHRLPPVLADYLYVRGLCLTYLGDAEGARRDAEAAYALFNVLGKNFEGTRAANLLGVLHFGAADFKAAKHWFFRSLDLNRGMGRLKRIASNRLNIGIACYKQGDLQQALAELVAADETLGETTQGITQCRVRIARGNVYRMMREFGEARAQLLPAYEQANQLERPREEALALEFMGDVLRDEGEVVKARRYYSRALAIGRSLAPEGDIVMEVMRRQGECLDLLGRHSESLPVLGRALTLARRLGDGFEEGVIQRILAEAMLSLGDHEAASHHSKRACADLRRIGAEFDLAQALLVAANIRLARLDSGLTAEGSALLNEAWQDAMTALGLFLRMDVEHHILSARQMLHTISRRRAEEENAVKKQDIKLGGENQQANGRNDTIIHVSSRIRDLVQLCDAFADSLEPVLITGSTGTGKELFARRLHRQSSRRAKELVCVNVAAIPSSLFEREFFGHVRGAFSGAETDRRGLAAQADGGTLFLDEIGELPLDSQPKLLRLLQEGTFLAIGDPIERRTDIRLVAATNANLTQLVAEGKFRADLYYRLKILELKLPDISERREDTLPLLQHFLGLAAGRPVELNEVFNRISLEMLQGYSWPGNVREIAMVARQAWVQLSTRGKVNVELGSDQEDVACLTGPHRVVGQEQQNPTTKGEEFRSRLLLALADTQGNRAEAARRLGISRSTLYRQMEKFGVVAKVGQG